MTNPSSFSPSRFRIRRTLALSAAAAVFAPRLAWAGDSITIGISAALQTAHGAALAQGTELALKEYNAAAKRHVKLVALDDGGNPQQAEANVRKVLQEDVACFMSFQSGACAEAASSLLAAAKIPTIGVSSGAESLRGDKFRWVYHTRAGRGVEAAAIVTQLDSIGVTKFAVLHSSDEFGREGYEGARLELARLAIRPEVIAAIAPSGTDIPQALAHLRNGGVEAVIVIANAASLASIVRGLRTQYQHSRVIAVSEADSDEVLRRLGGEARGLGFSQVLPNPLRTVLPVVRDYQAAMRGAAASRAPSYAGLEGYLNGRLLAEALRRLFRAGAGKLQGVLDNGEFDIGGFWIRYPQGNRRGTAFVEMSVVGPDGRLQV